MNILNPHTNTYTFADLYQIYQLGNKNQEQEQNQERNQDQEEKNKVKENQYSKLNKCDSCNDEECIIEDTLNGQFVCTTCGQIVNDCIFDLKPEWKAFDGNNDNARCSNSINVLLPRSSMGTTISGFGKTKMKTIATWEMMIYSEYSLNEVFKEIKRGCLEGKLTKCIEQDAMIIFKKLSECTYTEGKNIDRSLIFRGDNRHGLIANCVFLGCKRNNESRSSKEIASLFKVENKIMSKTYKKLISLLKAKKEDQYIHILKTHSMVSNPIHFIQRMCDKMHIKQVYTDIALNIAKNTDRISIASGHTPKSVAAAIILIMVDISHLQDINKKEIAKTFGLSEITLEKTYHHLVEFKHILNNTEFIDKVVVKLEEKYSKVETPKFLLDKLQNITLFEGLSVTNFLYNRNKELEMMQEEYQRICKRFEQV